MHLTFPFKDMVKPIYRRYLTLIFFHEDSSFCWYKMLPDGDRVTVIPLEIVQSIFKYFRDSPPPPLPKCDYMDPLTNLKCEETNLLFEECFICDSRRCNSHLKECEDCDECGCLAHMVQCAGSCDTFMCPACFKHIDKNGPYWCRDCFVHVAPRET
jgi:hypothetical protein